MLLIHQRILQVQKETLETLQISKMQKLKQDHTLKSPQMESFHLLEVKKN